MKQSERPIWKKSMLSYLNYDEIADKLWEIQNNGDEFGYPNDEESGYYQEYKPFFDELSGGASSMLEVLSEYELSENWDDMTVGLLGDLYTVYGFDAAEVDYFKIASFQEDFAVEEARTRLMRLTKAELITQFRQVLTTLVLFFDLKSSHDCLTSIVQELDERGAILNRKNDAINRLYEDLTGDGAEAFDKIVKNIPQRMWVE